MKTLVSDLFPETLLVDVNDGHTFTTSLKVAEYFGKRHDDVLKAIRKIIKQCKTESQLRNFAELYTTYKVKNGAKRTRPIFHLTRAGFEFVARGFTGPVAFEWNWKFIFAFDAMEAQLRARQDRQVAAFKQKHPLLNLVVEATEQGKSRAEIGKIINRKASSASYYRGVGRRLNMLPSIVKQLHSTNHQ